MGLQTKSILYQHSFYPHHYLCNYLPVSAGRDTLSRSLLKFKHGLQPDLDGWIDCSLELLAALPFPEGTIILRALQHDETIVQEEGPASMDFLGQALATCFHCHYQPALLRKSRITQPNKGLSRGQRRTELNDVYTLADPAITPGPGDQPALTSLHPLPAPPFLIIDDILTTGTTARMIIRAIRRHYPRSPLRVFTLAKADYDPTLNYSTPLRGQNYHLHQGIGWQVDEDEADYYSGENLRKWILADIFRQ